MKKSIKTTITIFSMVAITALSCMVKIPMELPTENTSISFLPFTLQNMFAVLAGILLGVPQGPSAVGIFLLLGVFGLPIFSSGTVGVAAISGYTGGFLVSYYLAAFFSGAIAGRPNINEKKLSIYNILKFFLAAFVGFVFIYVGGTIQYVRVISCSIIQGIQSCIIPFLVFDGIKLIAIVFIALILRPIIAQYIYTETEIL